MNNFHQINPHIDHFLQSTHCQKVWFASHTDTYPENAFLVKFSRIIYVLEGEYRTMIGYQGEHTNIVAKKGEIIFIPSQTWDLPDWHTDCRALTVLFGHYQVGMSLTHSTIDGDKDGKISVNKATINEPLQHEGFYLEKILNDLAISQRPGTAAKCVAEGLLRYCREKTEALIEPAQSATHHKWRAITLYLQKNFGPGITRETVALEYNISPNHLSRLFREEGGLGFNEYLTLVRIDRVKMLLSQYQMSMADIAIRTGFKDCSYLGRVFRRHTGMTLGEYRASYGS
ncbi:AraC family transcriptional regulator [uncultured Endozoicomonas sp.]|uniref:AraC family transcriptional regulator n=1 Tax=uncultured Endozoicomonas sp. TaxID=432652 RepID=UPI0026074BE1|nr:AraC family transcriptional regulator [uncultured Endozoicomonas sp.]